MIFCGRERIIISYTLKISYLDDDDLYLVVMGGVPFFASMGRDLLFCIYRFLNWGKKKTILQRCVSLFLLYYDGVCAGGWVRVWEEKTE